MRKKKQKVKSSDDLTCCFCQQAGIPPEHMPLSDKEREKKKRKSKKFDDRPLLYDFEFEYHYGGWIHDNRKDAVDNINSHRRSLSCHERCLTLSPLLFNNHENEGEENYLPNSQIPYTLGEKGFPRDAIIEECRRASKLYCSFCKKPGANIGCSIKNCQKKFHYPCAIENEFVCVTDNRTNPSFCIKHSTREFRATLSKGQKKYCLDVQYNTRKEGRKEIIKLKDDEHNKTIEYKYLKSLQDAIECNTSNDNPEFVCTLCADSFDRLESVIIAKCCQQARFHRRCISQYACNSGTAKLKCPLCQEMYGMFLKSIVAQGALCPNREASWEITGAYDDQLAENRQKTCVAPHCKEQGRENEDGTEWEIILCDYCGANGNHITCNDQLMEQYLIEVRDNKKGCFDWNCTDCEEMLANTTADSQTIEDDLIIIKDKEQKTESKAEVNENSSQPNSQNSNSGITRSLRKLDFNISPPTKSPKGRRPIASTKRKRRSSISDDKPAKKSKKTNKSPIRLIGGKITQYFKSPSK